MYAAFMKVFVKLVIHVVASMSIIVKLVIHLQIAKIVKFKTAASMSTI